MADITSFIRPDVLQMSAYQVADVPENFIKLDAMESPYHPFDDEQLKHEWLQEISQAPLNLYPNPSVSGLQELLKQSFNIPDVAKIALGNGSDELIQLITMLLAKPNAKMLALEPSFVMYRHNAALFGMEYIGVKLQPDFTMDLPAVLKAIEENQPALIFIAYPNNPTGPRFARQDVEKILDAAKGIVVVDEAYGAFSDDSFLNLAGVQPNLIVMRTLSKIGFAGIRLGYAAGHPDVMNELAKIIPPYNMNQLTLVTAKFALRHIDSVNQTIQLLKAERIRMKEALSAMPNVEAFDSEANFITVRVENAESLFESFKQAQILVKKLHGSHPLLDNCLRLTIGSPEQNDAVLKVMTAFNHKE